MPTSPAGPATSTTEQPRDGDEPGAHAAGRDKAPAPAGPGRDRAWLHGVVPPIVTPLTPERDVDVASLRRVTRHLLDAGVDGLFALGSTGEGPYLTPAQQRLVVAIVANETAGAVPVVAGAIDTATARVIDTARAVTEAGADGIVVTAPFYGPPHPHETEAHFRLIAAAADVPVIAYDNPLLVGSALDPVMVTALAREGVICALKDSSGEEDGMRYVLKHTGDVPGFAVLTGSETAVDVALILGADGVVPGLGNVDPHGYVRLDRAALAGDLATARREQARLTTLFEITGIADRTRVGRIPAGVGAFKEALVAMKIMDHATLTAPFDTLTPGERARIAALLTDAGLNGR